MQFYGSVTLDSVKIKAFKTAFPYTVPIGASFIFLGASYGFLMVSKGRVRFGNYAAWQF